MSNCLYNPKKLTTESSYKGKRLRDRSREKKRGKKLVCAHKDITSAYMYVGTMKSHVNGRRDTRLEKLSKWASIVIVCSVSETKHITSSPSAVLALSLSH